MKITFICHGNICRSPMAEFVFAHMANKAGLGEQLEITSRATSREEIGNDIHHGTREMLIRHDVPFTKRRATQITVDECKEADYLVCMDEYNVKNVARLGDFETSLLLEFAGHSRDIADPWYTGNFEDTYEDICLGCKGLLERIIKEKHLK